MLSAMTSAPFSCVTLAVAGLLATGAGLADSGLVAPNPVDTRLPAAQQSKPAADEPRAASPRVAAASGTRGTTGEELEVPADSVLGLQLETLATTHPEAGDDRVVARVTRDLIVGGRVAVPIGTRVLGTVTPVDASAKDTSHSGLEIRFDTLELPGGERVTIDTEPVTRDAGSGKPSLTRLGGGAAGGAAVGAILGGGKGAAIGGMLGAAGAAATTLEPGEVELRAGTALSVRTRTAFKVMVR